MLDLIKSLKGPATGFLRQSNFEYYVEFSMDEFIDDYEEERRNNGLKLGGIEGAHYTLLFLFDMLQFLFQHMIKSQSLLEPKKSYYHKGALTQEEMISPIFSFFIEGFEKLVKEVVNAIDEVCTDAYLLIHFWHLKNSIANSEK